MSASAGEMAVGQPWAARLLGGFQVERAGASAKFRTRKSAALLAHLVFHQGNHVAKEALAESLWPESPEKSRQSLRMAISSLRASLAAPGWDPNRYFQSDRDTIALLHDGFETDVGRFRASLRQAEKETDAASRRLGLEEAANIYSGPLLSGFTENWILPQALELEEAYAQAVVKLIGLLSQAEKLPDAVRIGRRALTIHPLREDLHVSLMRAYAEAGEVASAIRQYEELEQMLDEHWGESPGADARNAIETLPRYSASPILAAATSTGAVPAPPDLGAFFGREEETAELCQWLDPRSNVGRLATLVGLGGSGKTRLAQQAGLGLRDAFDGRVRFIPFVAAENEAQFHEIFLEGIGAARQSDADPVVEARAAIGSEPCLLIFDNVEGVAWAAARLAEKLLAALPHLRVLMTSRIPTDAFGERLMPLRPLPLPESFRDLNALRASPSVQLLVDAAQAVRPGFGVTPANAQSVLLLCRRLEGIPLALQLAAAKLAALSPAQVVASMSRRVDLSTSRLHVPERHRSLEEVVEWSLHLLEPGERIAFARLSLPGRGFNAALAQEMLGGDSEQTLQRLMRTSLLGWREIDDELRFEMLETVREIGLETLRESSQEYELATERLFTFVSRLCHAWSDRLTEEEKRAWVRRMDLETGNVRLALEAAAEGLVSPDQAWETAQRMRPYIERRGRPQVWIEPLETLLSATKSDVTAETLARAHLLLMMVHYGVRAIRPTYDHGRQAIAAADRSQDLILQIETRTELVTPAITLGEYDEAQKVLTEARELLLNIDDDAAAANCELNLGWVLFDRGQEAESEPHFRHAVALAERSGSLSAMGSAYTGLGCAIGYRNYEKAQEWFERSHEIWSGLAWPAFVAHNHYYRALVDYRHGRLGQALMNMSAAYREFVSNGVALGQTIETISGNLLSALGRHEDAALCWGRAAAARARQRMAMMPTLQRDFERELARVEAALGVRRRLELERQAPDLSDLEVWERLFGEP